MDVLTTLISDSGNGTDLTKTCKINEIQRFTLGFVSCVTYLLFLYHCKKIVRGQIHEVV